MAGMTNQTSGGAVAQPGQPLPPGERQVNDQDKAQAADWLKRIETAQSRPCIKEAVKRFERNRKLVRGYTNGEGEEKKRLRSNLYFANLAMLRPQIYAKDPEFAVKPARGVPPQDLKKFEAFCETAGVVLHTQLVQGCKLKKRAKRLLTGAYTTSVGWWKLCWQEDVRKDAAIANRLKDTQDNLQRLQKLRADLEDEAAGVEQGRQCTHSA